MEIKADFKWNKPLIKIASEATGGSEGMLQLAKTAASFMDPYVPADNLILAQNMDIYAEGDRGVIHYLSPYAHYQWEGEVYGPNIPIKDGENIVGWWSPSHKTPTGKKLEYSTFRHPLATSHWDEAMMTARKDDLVRSFEDYLKGRG